MNFIRSRKQWKARPARRFDSQDPTNVHTLVVHHTVGKSPVLISSVKRELRNIQSMHMDGHGWSDIGYNVLIDRYGRIWEGRGLRRVGAHTLGHNTGTVGVSFMGNYEVQTLNKRQLAAFNDLQRILRRHGFHIEAIKGHKQMPDQATACPGKNIMKQLGL